MKVVKYTDTTCNDLFIRCRLNIPKNVDIGDKILINCNKQLFGPFSVLDIVNGKGVVLADQNFNYYEYCTKVDVKLDELHPIFDNTAESITGSHILDGFLFAAFEEDGILRIEFSNLYTSLYEYYSGLMDEFEVQYQSVEGGFIIEDEELVSSIFSNYRPNMSIDFYIGYFSVFLDLLKVCVHGNPKYCSYELAIIDDYLDSDISHCGFFLIRPSMRHTNVCSFLGSKAPLSIVIDEVDNSIEEFNKVEPIVHFERIKKKVLPGLIYKIFYYSGYSISIPEKDYDGSYICKILIDGVSKKFRIMPEYDSDEYYSPYENLIFLENGTVKFLKECRYEDVDLIPVEFFYSGYFKFSDEIKMYFKVIFNKL